MKIRKEALLYDISNIAYVIADRGEADSHQWHQIRDICEVGNIDRVARILGLAHSQVLAVLSPLLVSAERNLNRDVSSRPHDYEIPLTPEVEDACVMPSGKLLMLRETVHEYLVCMVLSDWLGMLFHTEAEVWRNRAVAALNALKDIAGSYQSGRLGGFRRKVNPF